MKITALYEGSFSRMGNAMNSNTADFTSILRTCTHTLLLNYYLRFR